MATGRGRGYKPGPMTPNLSTYVASLDDEDRDTLLASIPLRIARVVGADLEFDELEMDAASTVLIETTEKLGPEFRWSAAAEAEFDKLCATARDAGPEYFAARLGALGDIVRSMPPSAGAQYRQFVKEMCLRLAAASGRVLWFGAAINESEKLALRKIAAALGISFGDLDART
jgi:hypothetical protein